MARYGKYAIRGCRSQRDEGALDTALGDESARRRFTDRGHFGVLRVDQDADRLEDVRYLRCADTSLSSLRAFSPPPNRTFELTAVSELRLLAVHSPLRRSVAARRGCFWPRKSTDERARTEDPSPGRRIGDRCGDVARFALRAFVRIPTRCSWCR